MAAEPADFCMQLLDCQPYFCYSTEVLCERSELQNKLLLRCARILESMQSAVLTRLVSLLHQKTLDLTRVRRRTMRCWSFLESSKRWNKVKSIIIFLG